MPGIVQGDEDIMVNKISNFFFPSKSSSLKLSGASQILMSTQIIEGL